MFNGIVPVYGIFFGNTNLVFKILLNPYMSPEAEYFIADHLLEAIYETQCNDHYSNAQCGSANGQPDNKT